jgi:hypothetical protein
MIRYKNSPNNKNLSGAYLLHLSSSVQLSLCLSLPSSEMQVNNISKMNNPMQEERERAGFFSWKCIKGLLRVYSYLSKGSLHNGETQGVFFFSYILFMLKEERQGSFGCKKRERPFFWREVEVLSYSYSISRDPKTRF